MAGVEQAMQMDHEIAHVGVVHRLLRLRLPRRIGGRVIGLDADDLDLIEVLERHVLEIGEFAADHEMKQLLRLATVRHDNTFLIEMPGKADVHGARRGQGSRMFLKCPTMRA